MIMQRKVAVGAEDAPFRRRNINRETQEVLSYLSVEPSMSRSLKKTTVPNTLASTWQRIHPCIALLLARILHLRSSMQPLTHL